MEKNLEKYLNRIAQNKETIYEELEKFFDVSYVEIWKYDSATKKVLFLKDTSVKINIQAEDNSFNHNIKALMITPLKKDKQILGFIRVFINVRKRKKFTRQDVKNLELCRNVALDFLQSFTIKKQVEENRNFISKRETHSI